MKGARRWFALRRGTLFWFKTVQAVDRVSEEYANGSLSLVRCSVAPMEGQKNTLAITPPADSGNTRVYDLGCYTVEEFQQWIKTLKAGVADASCQGYVDPLVSAEKGLVFGRDLVEVLEREGTELPLLVTECVEFLRHNALDSPGLFRLRWGGDFDHFSFSHARFSLLRSFTHKRCCSSLASLCRCVPATDQ